jgi:HD superfamily phosphohydrolase
MITPSVILAGFLNDEDGISRVLLRRNHGTDFTIVGVNNDLTYADNWEWSGPERASAAVLQYDYLPACEEIWPRLLWGGELPEYELDVAKLPLVVDRMETELAKGRTKCFSSKEFAGLIHNIEKSPFKQKAQTKPFFINSGKSAILIDPIHGDIELSGGELAVVDCPHMQRLRECTMHSTLDLIFPGATHTRFQHSLGTLAIFQKAIKAMLENEEAKRKMERSVGIGSDKIIRLGRLAALLHDVGYIPYNRVKAVSPMLSVFSESSEEMSRKWRSRILSNGLLSGLVDEVLSSIASEFNVGLINDILERKAPHFKWLSDLITGSLSASNLDRVVRDSFYVGFKSGTDIDRLSRVFDLASSEESSGILQLTVNQKSNAYIEHYLLSSFVLMERTLLHNTARAFSTHWDRFCSFSFGWPSSEKEFLRTTTISVNAKIHDLDIANEDAHALNIRKPFKVSWRSSLSLTESVRQELIERVTEVAKEVEDPTGIDSAVFCVFKANWADDLDKSLIKPINPIIVFSNYKDRSLISMLERAAHRSA